MFVVKSEARRRERKLEMSVYIHPLDVRRFLTSVNCRAQGMQLGAHNLMEV